MNSPVRCKLQDVAKSKSLSHQDARFASSVNLNAPPRAPPLLLTGDEHFISKDGKSHTLYKLKGRSPFYDIALKETYDIEKARKNISLVSTTSTVPKDGDKNSHDASTDSQLFSFDLQEINNGYKNGAGTGSMTWESSVAMSLFFTENPHELKGDVIELGSGVGMGAILSKVAKELSQDSDDVSVTCTDVNDDILDILEQNMEKAAKSNELFENHNMKVQKLDWFDYVALDSSARESTHYDTIIASDCAYLKSQVNPLSETISTLLGKESKLHMFAPANRSVVYSLMHELRATKQLTVQVEDFELSKNRIRVDKSISSTNATHISHILHITACHGKCNQISSGFKIENMHDID